MSKMNQEPVTTFAEVLPTSGISCRQQGHPATTDRRPMIYFQGMKVYVPMVSSPRRS